MSTNTPTKEERLPERRRPRTAEQLFEARVRQELADYQADGKNGSPDVALHNIAIALKALEESRR